MYVCKTHLFIYVTIGSRLLFRVRHGTLLPYRPSDEDGVTDLVVDGVYLCGEFGGCTWDTEGHYNAVFSASRVEPPDYGPKEDTRDLVTRLLDLGWEACTRRELDDKIARFHKGC